MRWITKKRVDPGFTLIEVMVALAVAGGALVLVLSANGASLRKSVNARLKERLERAAESKFAEWQIGAERASEGPLPGFDGHRWEVRTAREDIGSLKKLFRTTFTVTGSAGKDLEWALLRDNVQEGP
ncbi:MAG TPA: prepilin-type N-terminal cleavage/methylation domain-containing protein [Planctomycetota bacterium]|jgi:prepilin-type N-terminal cleavage/methylation domain-containing protein|nr:prepilin-type N-terminal cleavage/methylation domain-containing protein [Planctomycetota bacterium]